MDCKINDINTLQYLGSKSRIINEICDIIMSNSEIQRVVDLFAGTGTVGYGLKSKYTIISNDLELYSSILNNGILNGCLFSEEEEEEFFKNIDSMYLKIQDRFSLAIKKEKEYLQGDIKNYINYKKFCEDTPSVVKLNTNEKSMECILECAKVIKMGEKNQNIDIPMLFVTYYSNTYFGIEQCCEIDAIRYVISNINDKRVRNVLLTALMSVMSYTATTTTHFAQYLKINSEKSYKNIVSKRSNSIRILFKEKLQYLRINGLMNISQTKHICYNLDYLELLKSIPLDNSVLVYADPPYFKEHYSRYYHILNTLCLYDYPMISINNQTKDYTIGRYRTERNVSNFGKKKTALKAFDELIDICYQKKCYLAISYSGNSIVKIDEIIGRMEEKFIVDINQIPLLHSSQGRDKVVAVDEYVIIGSPKKNDLKIDSNNVDNFLKMIGEIKPISDNPGGFIHNYMARKPYNIVSEIIKELSPKDGLIYDPMFGSGTTLIEASKLGRSAIGTDINELAYKLAKISLNQWDLNEIKKILDSFVNKIHENCFNYYEYQHGDEVRIIERCHFDQIDGDIIPTSYWYKTITEKGLSGRKKDLVSVDFIDNYKYYESAKIENIKNDPLIPNSRIAIKDNATVYSYFCKRNLVVLDKIISILREYENQYGYEILEILVSSTLNLIKLSDKKASSQIPYWLPKKDLTSRNAVFSIENKKEKIINGLKYLDEQRKCSLVDNYEEMVKEKGIIIKNIPAQMISEDIIPKKSVDLVLTDPPYTDQVPYLEYSQLWSKVFRWKSHDESVMKEELVVSNAPSRNKDKDNFNNLLQVIIEKVSLFIKDNGYFVMFYHSFDLESWATIIALMEKYGLEYQGQAPIKAPRKSFKTVLSPKKTLDGNYVIVFRKRMTLIPVFDGGIDEAKEEVFKCARNIIASRENVTSQDLYDYGLLKDSIEKGYLSILAKKYKTFIDIVSEQFNYIDGHWGEK